MDLKLKFVTVFLVTLTRIHAGSGSQPTDGDKMKIFCYFTNWSNKLQYFNIKFQIKDINTTLCTHLIYAFAKIDSNSLRLIRGEVDDDNGLVNADRRGRYFEFNNLKIDAPHLVTFLSVGGAATKNKGFIQIVQSEENMKTFADNCAIYLRDRDFDGLDVDWEWPSIYRDKYTHMLQIMRQVFDEEAVRTSKPRLLIAIAVAVGNETITESYNIPEISKYVDFINVMAYDFHGPWNDVTSFTAPLHSRASNHQFSQALSQAWAIERWLSGGAPAHKLVMGMTATATYFKLINSSDAGVGAPANKTIAPKGPYLQQRGHLTYFRVCEIIELGAVTHWDNEQKMAYAVEGDRWIGYGNQQSMREKVLYVYSQKLAGAMFWSVELDDFSGSYCKQGRYPLLTAIYDAVQIREGMQTASPSQPQESTATTTPVDFRLHHKTNRNGINFFDMKNNAARTNASHLVFAVISAFIYTILK